MQEHRKYVGSFIWPFVRYDVLMPKQNRTDLFEWLYLSLVVHQNEQRNFAQNSYTKEVKDEVRHVIKQRFSSLLDDTVIDSIISTAEREFVVKEDTRHSANEYLSANTFSFLDTYEDLFSEQITVQRVFQDGICGGVVPCFTEDVFVKDSKNDGDISLQLLVKDKPTQKQIKNAYVLFNRLNSAVDSQEVELQDENEFYDEDAEVDFVPGTHEFEAESATKVGRPGTDFSTHFIDNSRCEYKLEIPVYFDGEKLYIGTPFDSDTTLKWMNKRLLEARSVCAELDQYFQSLEAKYIGVKSTDKGADVLQFVYRKGIADQMTKCGDIYRLIDHLPEQYNDLKKILIDIDKQFVSKHKSYFNALGTYLECLLHQFVDRTDVPARQYYDYNQYCSMINYTCANLGVNGRPFLSENVFKNWQKGWDHFKADLAGLFLSNAKMRGNAKTYTEFVQDTFDLYDKRNNGSHYKQGITYNYEDTDITKLFNVTRVLIELI